jgi:hypothetical protein
VPARERIGHGIEDRLDGELGVTLRELREALGQLRDEIGTATSSPSVTTLAGATFLLVQSISETCTRPSMPGSISTKAP